MATSPICPKDFEQANFGKATCDLLTQLLLTNEKLSKFFSWAFDENCRLSADFVAEFRTTLQPIGSVIWFPCHWPPPQRNVKEWVEADGQMLNKEEFAELFKLYGTSFGESTDKTKFAVPNLKGRFLIGYGKRTANRPVNENVDDDEDNPETKPGTMEYLLADSGNDNTGLGGFDEIALTPAESIGGHQHGIGGIPHRQEPPLPGGDDQWRPFVNYEVEDETPWIRWPVNPSWQLRGF
jgi:Phage Tail Collar Domain